MRRKDEIDDLLEEIDKMADGKYPPNHAKHLGSSMSNLEVSISPKPVTIDNNLATITRCYGPVSVVSSMVGSAIYLFLANVKPGNTNKDDVFMLVSVYDRYFIVDTEFNIYACENIGNSSKMSLKLNSKNYSIALTFDDDKLNVGYVILIKEALKKYSSDDFVGTDEDEDEDDEDEDEGIPF